MAKLFKSIQQILNKLLHYIKSLTSGCTRMPSSTLRFVTGTREPWPYSVPTRNAQF